MVHVYCEGGDQFDGRVSERPSNSSDSSSVYLQKRRDEDQGDLKFEFNRLETFLQRWPTDSPVEPENLARDGFFFLGALDRVRCIFCEVVLRGWEPGDCVRDSHLMFSNGCPFIHGQSVGNVPYYISDISSVFNVGMSIWKKRLLSFREWPKAIAQKPRVLAAAGFYYKNRGDIVQCFCCGGIVKQWLETDDPWLEHMKHFPLCPHIRENIAYHVMPTTSHQTQTEQPGPPSIQESGGAAGGGAAGGGAAAVPQSPTHRRIQRSTSEIALSMGYRTDLISIYRQYLRKQGKHEAEDPNIFIDDLERFKVQPETQPPGGSASTGQYMTDGQVFDKKKRSESVSSFCSSCSSSLGFDEPDCCYIKLECGHCVCCEVNAFECTKCPECNKDVKVCLNVPLQSSDSQNVRFSLNNN